MFSALALRCAGAAGLAALLLIGALLWTRRGDELATAQAQRAQAVQTLTTMQASLQADQQTIAALQAQQTTDNAALAQVSAGESATAATAATISAQIATREDGPVAPVLARTLADLAQAQGVQK